MLCDFVDRNGRFVVSCSLCVQNKEDTVYTASYRGRWSYEGLSVGLIHFIVPAVGFIINRDRHVLSSVLLSNDGISVTVDIIVVRG
jgi:hypothetical protein